MQAILLLALLHLVIGVRLGPALPAGAAAALTLWLLASTVLIPAAFFGRRAHGAAADRWSWAGMLALGAFSMLLVLTLLREAALLLAWALGHAGLAGPSAAAVPLLALAACAAGLVAARRTPRVRHVQVPIDRLPAALHGFTIAQITDLHVGPTIKAPFVRRVVERVNALQPDAVAITGDLVDGPVAALHEHVAPLAALRSRHGSFFVTGNHEFYSGADEWVAALRGMGVRVLRDEHVVLAHEGAALVLAGIDDPTVRHFGGRGSAQAALAGAPPGLPRVMLAHQPRSAPAVAEAGADLQLSGHTHGGQFWPWNLAVPLQQPFVAGLRRLGRLWVYTSRGTGYWGPPLRLGAPSEITCVKLVPAAPQSAR